MRRANIPWIHHGTKWSCGIPGHCGPVGSILRRAEFIPFNGQFVRPESGETERIPFYDNTRGRRRFTQRRLAVGGAQSTAQWPSAGLIGDRSHEADARHRAAGWPPAQPVGTGRRPRGAVPLPIRWGSSTPSQESDRLPAVGQSHDCFASRSRRASTSSGGPVFGGQVSFGDPRAVQPSQSGWATKSAKTR
jgi:hypothetical protein